MAGEKYDFQPTSTSPSTQTRTLTEERVAETATSFLHNEDAVQVGGSTQPQDCIHGHVGKEVPVVGQHFGAQGGASNVQQVVAELLRVCAVVLCGGLQSVDGNIQRQSVPYGGESWMTG